MQKFLDGLDATSVNVLALSISHLTKRCITCREPERGASASTVCSLLQHTSHSNEAPKLQPANSYTLEKLTDYGVPTEPQ